MVRFLVLSPARSGSTVLRMTLNRHPRVRCHGEILAPNRVLGLVPDAATGMPADRELLAKIRDRDPCGFIDRVLEVDADAAGFKAIYNQLVQLHAATVLESLVSDTALRVVMLWRRNLCKRFLSEVRHSSGYASKTRGADAVHVAPDPETMFQDFANQRAMRRRYEAIFRAHPTLSLDFEDMEATGRVRGLLGFLGVSDDDLVLPDERIDFPSGVKVVVDNESELLDRYSAVRQEYEPSGD